MSLSSINSEFVSQSSPPSTSMLTMEKGGRGIYEHPVLVMDRIKQHIAALEVIAVGDDAYPVLLLSICEKSRIVQEKLQALLSTASSATGCRKKYSQMLQILERWVKITTRYALFLTYMVATVAFCSISERGSPKKIEHPCRRTTSLVMSSGPLRDGSLREMSFIRRWIPSVARTLRYVKCYGVKRKLTQCCSLFIRRTDAAEVGGYSG